MASPAILFLALATEETDGVVGSEEAGLDAAQIFDAGSMADVLKPYSVADLAKLTGLSRRAI